QEWCEGLARRRQFLQRSQPSELPDGTLADRYTFLHALHRTALYDQVPAARRAELHRRIGERLEALHGARAHEIAAELAIHFEQGRDWPRALAWLQQAAANATNRSASREAVVLAERGLALLPRMSEGAERSARELALQMTLGSASIA